MNELILIIFAFTTPISTLVGVFLGFWIAWKCLKQEPLLIGKTQIPEDEEETESKDDDDYKVEEELTDEEKFNVLR